MRLIIAARTIVSDLTKRQASGYKPDLRLTKRQASGYKPDLQRSQVSGYKPDLRRFAVVFLVLCLLWLAACSQQPEADAIPASEVALVDEEAVAPEPTAAALVPEQPSAESESADECLLCHTDKEMLIRTVSPEEEVISENEGEG